MANEGGELLQKAFIGCDWKVAIVDKSRAIKR